jgi:tetratricopeptide (TPR) repeat protein
VNVTILVVAAALAVAFPRAAFADKKSEVQKHLNIAYAAYKEGRWQDVLDALDKAYAIDPKPELHYSRGQVFVKMERCAEAIVAYEKYLASNPKTDNAMIAREAIEVCKSKVATTTPPVRDPKPPVEDTPRVLNTDTPRDGGGGNKLGLALIGTGSTVVLAGAGMYLLARADLGDATSAPTYGEQEDLYDRAGTKRLIAIGLVAGGTVIAGIGIVRSLTKKPREQRRIGAAPLRGGGFVTWGTAF